MLSATNYAQNYAGIIGKALLGTFQQKKKQANSDHTDGSE